MYIHIDVIDIYVYVCIYAYVVIGVLEKIISRT